MLNPNVNDTIKLLKGLSDTMSGTSSYGVRCNSLVIGHVPLDPEWLFSVRSRASKLREVMNDFVEKTPEIYASILSSFINYQTLFSAFSAESKNIKGKDQWLEFLGPLRDSLKNALSETKKANDEFDQAYKNVRGVQFLLEESIQEGWAELSHEEKEMVAIAEAIGTLETSVADLGVSLTEDDIRSGKSVVQSVVTMAYGIVVGTASVPYLSIASTIFTLEKSFYDIIKTEKNIHKQLEEIANLQNKESGVVQAAAITKTVIQVLNTLMQDFLREPHLPALSSMWQDELDKLESAIEALKSGADPDSYFDLQTMKISSASWSSISKFVIEMRKPPAVGKSVTINCLSQTIQSNN